MLEIMNERTFTKAGSIVGCKVDVAAKVSAKFADFIARRLWMEGRDFGAEVLDKMGKSRRKREGEMEVLCQFKKA